MYGFTNFSGGTLTGGTWQAAGSNSVLQLIGADITTNAANVLLDGAGADPRWRHHRGAGGPSANTAGGSLTLKDGAALASPGAFSNQGSLTVGAGSGFTVKNNGNYTSAGGASSTAP